jgi:hypothetical protein
MEKIKHVLFKQKELSAINYLRYLYNAQKWDNFCHRAIDFFGEQGPQYYYGEERSYNCAPPAVQELMNLRKARLPTDRTTLTKLYNKLAQRLFKDFDPSKVLELIGKENFFATTRVTGFREHSPEGFLEYMSNSIGHYNSEYGTGTFDMIAAQLGVSAFELRAMMYTPSM